MSFSGKKFRRIGCENMDTLVRTSRLDPRVATILNSRSPVFSYTRIGENEFRFHATIEGFRDISYTFKLNEEFEFERWDGCKIRTAFSLEGDNVMNQVIRLPGGKMGYFRREFGEKESIMILRIDGAESEAKIYYELVE